MVKTLRESKSKLSKLVDKASRGGDVRITARGAVKARLSQVEASPAGFDGRAWADELRALQEAVKSRKKPKLATGRILAELRADRG
jgi:prevent-host-death family protein